MHWATIGREYEDKATSGMCAMKNAKDVTDEACRDEMEMRLDDKRNPE